MKRIKDEEPITADEYPEDKSVGRSDVGPVSAGQSGDTQGVSTSDDLSSETVAELLEEGQYYEASVISGIENAPRADVSELKTREVPEDDVPAEYWEEDDEPPKHD
ncbi:MAG: hypothetical protein WBW33_18185 [Bryobacteraceae bacterium]